MTSWPLVRRTLATFRMAELGFLGVRVITWIQTPRRKGELSKAGDLDLCFNLRRPLRTNWLIVGIFALQTRARRIWRGKQNAKYTIAAGGCNNYFQDDLCRCAAHCRGMLDP